MSHILLDLQIACRDPLGLPTIDNFQHWLQATLNQHHHDAEVTLRLVDEAESQQLNKDYRGKAYPTNVLAFPYDTAVVLSPRLLGDLIICRQVVEREACEHQIPLMAHWAHMVIHGCLHLLGYDHDADPAAVKMESLEANILHTLGYANPYRGETTPLDPSQSYE
jgi:probable rRNA maturation factor